MAGKSRPGHQPSDDIISGRRGASAAQSVRLPPDEAETQSNLEALAQLKPDTPSAAVDRPTLRIKRVWQGALDQSVWPEARYTSAGKSGSGRGLLSVWMDRQWSNKLECHVAQARRVVMAHGLAGAHRAELKDKQLLRCARNCAVTS